MVKSITIKPQVSLTQLKKEMKEQFKDYKVENQDYTKEQIIERAAQFAYNKEIFLQGHQQLLEQLGYERIDYVYGGVNITNYVLLPGEEDSDPFNITIATLSKLGLVTMFKIPNNLIHVINAVINSENKFSEFSVSFKDLDTDTLHTVNILKEKGFLIEEDNQMKWKGIGTVISLNGNYNGMHIVTLREHNSNNYVLNNIIFKDGNYEYLDQVYITENVAKRLAEYAKDIIAKHQEKEKNKPKKSESQILEEQIAQLQNELARVKAKEKAEKKELN